MYSKENLTCGQAKALYEYISSDHLIINSGRCSGKSKTLIEVFKFWLEYQMKNSDTCVLIGHSLNANTSFVENLFRSISECAVTHIGSSGYKLVYNNKICYIKMYTTIMQYFFERPYGPWIGLRSNATLMLGDERYISDDWCSHTACAFTQRRNVMTLECSDDATEKIKTLRHKMCLDDYKLYMNK